MSTTDPDHPLSSDPNGPQSYAQSPPASSPTQYGVPPQAAYGAASPAVPPTYAPPPHVPAGPYSQHPGIGAAHLSRGSRTNILGISALALLLVQVLLGGITPFLYRAATDNFMAITTGITVVNILILLAALGLAIGGVIQRNADRFRWTAIGSLVAGGIGVVGMIVNLLGGWASSVMYW